MQAVAKRHFQLCELLEVVANDGFVGHAHAAMQLHRLLADKAHGVAQLVFGARHRSAALGRRGVELEAGVIAHGAGQFELHLHVGDAVAQGLEAGNGHAELFARVHVVGGGGQRHVHHTHAFSAGGGNADVHCMLQGFEAVRGNQKGGRILE